MTYRALLVMSLVVLCVGIILSGCDRLSEKDKMEMIAKCDSEAREKIKEDTGTTGNLSWTTIVETHYSFSDKQCYALETRTDNLPSTRKTLYDGLTKKTLLETRECCGYSDAGYSIGPLSAEGKKNDKDLVPYKEGVRIIEERMNRP